MALYGLNILIKRFFIKAGIENKGKMIGINPKIFLIKSGNYLKIITIINVN